MKFGNLVFLHGTFASGSNGWVSGAINNIPKPIHETCITIGAIKSYVDASVISSATLGSDKYLSSYFSSTTQYDINFSCIYFTEE